MSAFVDMFYSGCTLRLPIISTTEGLRTPRQDCYCVGTDTFISLVEDECGHDEQLQGCIRTPAEGASDAKHCLTASANVNVCAYTVCYISMIM